VLYLDAAATTPVRREVLEAMWPYLTGDFGNPSSQSALGFSAATALSGARRAVATRLGVRASEVIFTSGGTEADNLAIKGIALATPRGRHLVISAIEHEAVLESARYLERFHDFAVTTLPVDSAGLVAPAALASVIRPDTTLVSIMYANNEIGTVQPIAELAEVARAAGVPFHTDAVQAAGVLPLDLTTLGVDALSISGHKLGAPKGIGVLVARSRVALEPLVHGGGQERGIRSGTENVAGAVGLARALELASGADASVILPRRDRLVAGVLATVPQARLTGHPTARLPGHASFVFPGTSGESLLLELENRGIITSSGSACAAGSDESSAVLLALGLSPGIAQTAVRFSFGAEVSDDDIETVIEAVGASVAAVRGLAPR
jgi:cysteine desulfurase